MYLNREQFIKQRTQELINEVLQRREDFINTFSGPWQELLKAISYNPYDQIDYFRHRAEREADREFGSLAEQDFADNHIYYF